MKNIRKLKKTLFAILCVSLSQLGVAGTLFTFDDSYLMAMTSKGNVVGYYGIKNDGFSCLIFFANSYPNSVTSKDKEFDLVPIRIFVFDYRKSSFEYAQRDTEFDIAGTLYVRQNEWTLQSSSMPPGCANVTGSLLNGPEAPGAQRFLVSNKVPALGIKVVAQKAFFYNKSGNTFSRRRGHLEAGDVVAVLEQNGNYSYVRFTNPGSMISDPANVTRDWVRTSDLEDPFPFPPEW